jgi:hypothetical protein
VRVVSDVQKALATVAAIVGRRPDPDLPTEQTIREAIEARLGELGEFIDVLEPTIDDYSRAMQRVIAKRAPNERKEQFRDSLALEQLLRQYPHDEGFLVTQDSDYFAAKGSGELPPTLKEEFVAAGARLRIVRTIEDVLTGLGQEALQPDRETILRAISQEVLFTLQSHSLRHGYGIGETVSHRIDAFLTEDHDHLFVSFEVALAAFGIQLSDGSVLREGSAVAKGTATFDLRTQTASNVQIGTVQVCGPTGEIIHQAVTVFAEGATFLGARTAPYRLRRALDHDPLTR